ncbi:MAG: hypothetical protein FWF20_11765 [Betaproteobacteria bacterium]|nr:hypothetical protein [Betaproteobacteria bacterium]MCL2887426.1 hypothetical protein [Betaproteobacteria bacterium]
MLEILSAWLSRYTLPIALLAVFAAGALIGGDVAGRTYREKIAVAEAAYEKDRRVAAESVALALTALREKEAEGEKLAARQLELEATGRKLEKEKNNALKKLTTGRPCLDGATVRLLNASADPAGKRSLSAHPADALEAATAFATDTDIALWANHVRFRYDACRGRIDAIREFAERAQSPLPHRGGGAGGEGEVP